MNARRRLSVTSGRCRADSSENAHAKGELSKCMGYGGKQGAGAMYTYNAI